MAFAIAPILSSRTVICEEVSPSLLRFSSTFFLGAKGAVLLLCSLCSFASLFAFNLASSAFLCKRRGLVVVQPVQLRISFRIQFGFFCFLVQKARSCCCAACAASHLFSHSIWLLLLSCAKGAVLLLCSLCSFASLFAFNLASSAFLCKRRGLVVVQPVQLRISFRIQFGFFCF